MLQDGNALRNRGVDVVLGYVEPHDRKDMLDQIKDLEEFHPNRSSIKGLFFMS